MSFRTLRFIGIFLTLGSLLEHGVSYGIERDSLLTTFMDPQDTEEVKTGFLEAFRKAYEPFTAEDLQVKDKDACLKGAFQEEVDDREKKGVYQVMLKTEEGELVGYFSVDNMDERKEHYQGFPVHSSYIRLLFVTPPFQRKGVGELMVSKILYEYLPSLKHVFVATRRFNKAAQNLYESLGFKESEKILHDLPQDRYISFELHYE